MNGGQLRGATEQHVARHHIVQGLCAPSDQLLEIWIQYRVAAANEQQGFAQREALQDCFGVRVVFYLLVRGQSQHHRFRLLILAMQMEDGLPVAPQNLLHRIGLLPGDGGVSRHLLKQMVVIQCGNQSRQRAYILQEI